MKKLLVIAFFTIFLAGCNCCDWDWDRDWDGYSFDKCCKGCLDVSVTSAQGQTIPAAEIYINGKFVGMQTWHNIRLACGDHNIRVTSPGFGSYERILTITGQQQNLNVVLEPQ